MYVNSPLPQLGGRVTDSHAAVPGSAHGIVNRCQPSILTNLINTDFLL